MGRAPCCDKENVKKGPWSTEEDAKLKSYIEKHGTGGNWIALPQKIGLKRCGKSCRLRWLNYLRPNIKHGGFSEEEENIICSLYITIGSRWSIIAAQLPGRTDNDIKNYWNTRLKKKLLGKQRKEHHAAAHIRGGEGGLIKQQQDNNIIIKRSHVNTSSSMVSTDTNIGPYWPELPVNLMAPVLPYEQEQLNNKDDDASIRKFLIKLGGKFSDHQVLFHEQGTNFQFPNFDHHQFLEQPSSIALNNMPSSSASLVDDMNQFVQNHQYSNTSDESGSGLHMLQGQNSTFPVGIEEEEEEDMLAFSNNNQQQNLEFLYSENNRIESTPGWGEMTMINSLFPPAVVAPIGKQPPQMLKEDAASSDQLRYSSDQQCVCLI